MPSPTGDEGPSIVCANQVAGDVDLDDYAHWDDCMTGRGLTCDPGQ
ncbi:MAG: hypothetical protein ACYSUQ_07900 [Planctomycetota bacterium]